MARSLALLNTVGGLDDVPRRPYLTPAEAAEYLGVTPGFLSQRRYRHLPPTYSRLGPRAIRYTIADLDEYAEGSRVEPEAA